MCQFNYHVLLVTAFFCPCHLLGLSPRKLCDNWISHYMFEVCILSFCHHASWTLWWFEVGNKINVMYLFPCIWFRFLRLDALSLLLSFANVTANSDVLVIDMVGGLLTGAVAERLGGIFSIILGILKNNDKVSSFCLKIGCKSLMNVSHGIKLGFCVM